MDRFIVCRGGIGRKAWSSSNLGTMAFALTYEGEKHASNYHHGGVRLALVVGLQSHWRQPRLPHDPRFRACRLRVLLQGRHGATVGLVEIQLGLLSCLHPA